MLSGIARNCPSGQYQFNILRLQGLWGSYENNPNSRTLIPSIGLSIAIYSLLPGIAHLANSFQAYQWKEIAMNLSLANFSILLLSGIARNCPSGQYQFNILRLQGLWGSYENNPNSRTLIPSIGLSIAIYSLLPGIAHLANSFQAYQWKEIAMNLSLANFSILLLSGIARNCPSGQYQFNILRLQGLWGSYENNPNSRTLIPSIGLSILYCQELPIWLIVFKRTNEKELPWIYRLPIPIKTLGFSHLFF